jgi:RsmE family RNA methyltransferase
MESASVIVLVGPEGGWAEAERRATADAGYARWCFNRFVLRVETAGLIAAGLIRAATVSQSE